MRKLLVRNPYRLRDRELLRRLVLMEPQSGSDTPPFVLPFRHRDEVMVARNLSVVIRDAVRAFNRIAEREHERQRIQGPEKA